jgi:hypothetical protein
MDRGLANVERSRQEMRSSQNAPQSEVSEDTSIADQEMRSSQNVEVAAQGPRRV